MPITLNKTILATKEGNDPMDRKDAFRRKLEADLEKWTDEIDRLEARAVAASAELQKQYQAEVETLRQRQAEAEQHLDAFTRAEGDAWEDMRSGLERTWTELGKAVQRATDGWR